MRCNFCEIIAFLIKLFLVACTNTASLHEKNEVSKINGRKYYSAYLVEIEYTHCPSNRTGTIDSRQH
uniref:Putative secreted peptide n=1 Tax=Anopheles braziliensis TaxID=58242 RepID=A0A2M3ZRX6_9DIPT